MRTCTLFSLLALSVLASAAGPANEPETRTRSKAVEGWGEAVDPAGDCNFEVKEGRLRITVPSSDKPHDLSPELESSTAPRVLRPVKGDFTIEVKVGGEFEPGEKSTQEGRTGYTGAGLVVFADEKNFVRLER